MKNMPVCSVCGETYFGSEKSTRCNDCGAEDDDTDYYESHDLEDTLSHLLNKDGAE